jgi:cholesterol transport system auxiliary component
MKALMTGLALIGCLILAVSSCTILPKAQPSAVHDFGYPNSHALSEISTPTQQTPITVEAPKWLSDNRIRYRLLYADPTQVRFYSLDRWIAPPPELFEPLLNASTKQWPKPITIQLDVFEQQFDSPDKAKVVMHFSATTTPDDKQHKSRTRNFKLQLPCLTSDAKGAVTGFNLLTKQAVDKLQAWLMEAN